MTSPEGGVRDGRYVPHLIRTEAELAEAVAHVSKFDHFVIDVESPKVNGKFLGTTQNPVTWVGIAVPDRIMLVPMGHDRGLLKVPAHKEKRLLPEEERKVLKNGTLSTAKKSYSVEATYYDGGPQLRQDVVFEYLRPLLFSDRTKIGHNLKFDLESITKYLGGVIPPGPYMDTMLMLQVLNENLLKYELKSTYMDMIRVPKDADVRKAFYPNLGKIGVETQPIDEVARYLAMDVWRDLLYYRICLEELRAEPRLLDVLQKDEMTVYPILMKMEMQGIRVDTKMLAERKATQEAIRDQLAQDIWDICGESFEITNLAEKRRFLYGPKSKGGQGLKPRSFTEKTHQPQVTEEVLQYYAGEGNPLAAKLVEWTEVDKMISTFFVGLTDKLIGDRLHTSFNQHRTVTGRLSSSGPNLHQIPRGTAIRDCFIADDGFKLIVADYSSMELREACFFSGDPELRRIFDEDLDIHTEATAAMLGLTLDQVTPELRMVGKEQNLGTLYGAGGKKVAWVASKVTGEHVSDERGEEFVDAYNQRFIIMTNWKRQEIMRAKNSVRPGGGRIPFVEIPPYGRKRRLPDLFSQNFKERGRAERQVVNAIVQGYGAYMLKQAMRDLDPKLTGNYNTSKVLLNVHDELIVMAPEAQAEEVALLVKSTMEDVRSPDGAPAIGDVPLKVNAAVADRWSEGK